jgi:sugar/nucleoside kinase (ribokinase family)
MNTLGGAGTHALVGMRIWNPHLGYCAAVGADLSPSHRRELSEFGVDLDGLVLRDGLVQARAWQLFEPDERRIEIFRTDLDEFRRGKVQVAEIPESYKQARGFHLQWGTVPELIELIAVLKAANPGVALALEPNIDVHAGNIELYPEIMPHLALFSPDLGEGQAMTGHQEPDGIFDTLFSWGANLVALRMGAYGSIIRGPSAGSWRLPAVPVSIVDVTGAGNSYVGGFLTGLGDGLSAPEAALRGAVSASFALEQFGLPAWRVPPTDIVEQRLAWARDRTEMYR